MSHYYGIRCLTCNVEELSLINRGSSTIAELYNNFAAIKLVNNLCGCRVESHMIGWKDAYLFILHHEEHALQVVDEHEHEYEKLGLSEEGFWCECCKLHTLHEVHGPNKKCTRCFMETPK